MKLLQIAFLALLSIMCFNGSAQTSTEIMKKNYEVMATNDEQVDLTMVLINTNGQERSRSVRQYTKTSDNLRSALIQFLAPADIKGTGFLSIENKGREDDQWLYLPALKSTRQISSSSETDNFMGSDFTYEDLKREKLDDFSYTLKGEEAISGTICFIIEAIPVKPERIKSTGYSKRIIYVCNKTFLFVKVKYFDKKGEEIKTYTAQNIQNIEGFDFQRPFKMTMSNLKTGNKTDLIFSKYSINKGLQADLFTRRYLSR